MEITALIWHSFMVKKPEPDSVFLVRGEKRDNGHASEYYIFIEEGGKYITAETNKPVRECFKDYMFTHWAYIKEPASDLKKDLATLFLEEKYLKEQ